MAQTFGCTLGLAVACVLSCLGRPEMLAKDGMEGAGDHRRYSR